MCLCPAILMLYKELAQVRTGFQEIKNINSMSFQAALNTALFHSVKVAKVAPGCDAYPSTNGTLHLPSCFLMQPLGIKGLHPFSLCPINFMHFKAELCYKESCSTCPQVEQTHTHEEPLVDIYL